MANKKVLTASQRDTIVKIANAFMADPNNSQEDKASVFFNVESMLHLCEGKGYGGFNWIKWSNGGGTAYFSDHPEAKNGEDSELMKIKCSEQYMGLDYDRFFY